jgi:hypothetical protein
VQQQLRPVDAVVRAPRRRDPGSVTKPKWRVLVTRFTHSQSPNQRRGRGWLPYPASAACVERVKATLRHANSARAFDRGSSAPGLELFLGQHDELPCRRGRQQRRGRIRNRCYVGRQRHPWRELCGRSDKLQRRLHDDGNGPSKLRQLRNRVRQRAELHQWRLRLHGGAQRVRHGVRQHEFRPSPLRSLWNRLHGRAIVLPRPVLGELCRR